jgi:rhamnulokinase
MDAWSAEGRVWKIEDLIAQAAVSGFPGVIDVDAEPLLLDSEMPERINHQLWRRRWATIPDIAGNEPVFARVIFESLAERYAFALTSLENLLGRKLDRIHILGGASRNKLVTELTEKRTQRPVEIGHTESSTIGNLAVQLAASESSGQPATANRIRHWAAVLSQSQTRDQSNQ